MSSGVPSNAEKVILSKIASLGRGASSGRSSKPGVREEPGPESVARATRCQAIACRNWRYTGELEREREMAEEEDAHTGLPGRLERLEHPLRNIVAASSS